jgi:Tol biopolymer transport system component
VAIKTLPEEFARDPGRAARFEHEARTLASLSHPHIASLYGLEEVEGRRFLVMELVEGQTLAERIARGALPLEEALALAAQIAAALEAAHERGIVHRDLKPANVKVTPEGNVKVLDFGLAKALADELSPASVSLSPTLTAAATRAGVILGTAAYMSPEQARGQKIDRRADVWAFGCVLYEMLTGRQAFGGETVSDSISHVLMREPDWSALPSATPTAVRRLLRRCLEKKADRRLRDLGDARLEIEEAAADGSAAVSGSRDAGSPAVAATSSGDPRAGRGAERLVMGALALVAVAAVAYAIRTATVTAPQAGPVRRLAVPLVDNPGILNGRLLPTLSMDGSRLAYITMKDGRSRVAVRGLDQSEASPLAGTEGATIAAFSPDGRQVAFCNAKSLSTTSLDGGAVNRVADATMMARIAWTPDGSLIFSPAYNQGLSIVPAAGGKAVALTTTDPAAGELGHWHPTLLPDGRSVMFTVFRSGGVGASRIDLIDLKTRARRHLLDGFDARYASSGHLLFARGDTLYAVPFDAGQNRLSGEPIPVLQGVVVDAFDADAQYDISRDGTLVYLPAAALMRRLAWREPDGTIRPIVDETRPFMYPAMSPDGRTVAVTIFERGEADVWLADVERGVLSRLTNRPQTDFLPVWSPDGRRLAFDSDDRAFTLYTVPTDGSAAPERLIETPRDNLVGSWSPDGRTIAYTETVMDGSNDIRLLDVASPGSSRPFFSSPASESSPRISPDGHRIAFTSDESGRVEVYVAAFDGTGGKTRVSTGGGNEPRWAPDGSVLFYRSGDSILSVALGAGPDPRPQAPKVVFTDPLMPEGWAKHPNYDVSRDGRRFVIIEKAIPGEASLQVILNFTEELKRRVPHSR